MLSDDGIDRRGFLRCMQWAGTGVLWTMAGGVPESRLLGQPAGGRDAGGFSFIQISDSHIGFNRDANKDVTATLQQAVAKINSGPVEPDFLIHTGDITHLSKPEEFDTIAQVLKSAKPQQVFYVPGEHDVLGDNGKQYLERYGRRSQGNGWYSFDHKGVHFIGLVNVLDLKAGGLGMLGDEQLEWLEKDVQGQSPSTPIVVFAHIPLWSVYPEWGWGTSDSERALGYLKKFGSVTVLNGHIHQTMQKVEGNVTFHTAMSTAFPQPQPGAAPSPGPMKVPDDQLRSVLGLASINYVQSRHALAIVDSSLSGGPGSAAEVHIDNFSFTPASLAVRPGATVTWTNRDDIPHNVVSTEKKFSSPVLDTGEKFSYTFTAPGAYAYYCSIHPKMTAKVVVG
ncbi:MAG TPA: metallophosphoesterase [Bryobacteraceae bacterium]|nr:metallophosphoesterase [Bryobacteraceae bacterium]